jgi:hypothetical protein
MAKMPVTLAAFARLNPLLFSILND